MKILPLVLGIVIFLFLSAVKATYVPPSEVYIGGLFNPVISAPDEFQIELVSAFVQAIDEINSRSDILPNTQLKYMIRSGSGVEDASFAGIEMVRSSYNVTAFVGGLPNAETSALHQVFIDTKKVMAHSVASSAMFANPMNYPYKVQTNAIDSSQGNIIQHMMCNYYNYTRAVIFASFDDYGSKSIIELTDGSYCNLNILATVTFPTFENYFGDYISQVLPLDATVFVLLMNYTNAGILLEEGYSMGLFREGTQIFGSTSFLNPLLFNSFSPEADVTSIMKGMIVPEYFPLDHLIEHASELKFISGWRSHYSTLNNCSNEVDSTGYHYLYPGGDTTKTCYGLNFQSYFANGSDMNPFAALTYDATYLIAHGIDNLTRSGIDITGDTLLEAIFNNVSFAGATGIVEISPGEPLFDDYGRGDRKTGNEYRIHNFYESRYLSSPNTSFVSVGIWDPVHADLQCIWYDKSCFPIIYNTLDNSVPSCYPPYAYSKPPSVIKIGALFSPFDEFGNVDKVQVENLAAFLLAVKVINNKTDGIADDLLPDSELRFAFRPARGFAKSVYGADALLSSFFGSGVLGVVNGLPNLETMSAAELLGEYKVVQSHSMAMDSALGFASSYPYKVQTCPIDSVEGVAIQDIVCRYFGYTKVSVFSTSDTFGSMSALEFQDGTYCGNVILSSYSFLTDQLDYSNEITLAKSVGAQIFVLFLPPLNAAILLEQGYNMGLFVEGTQIISSSQSAVPELFSYFTDTSIIDKVMKGFISMQYWPKYSLTRTSEGMNFMDLWRAQKSTLPALKNGIYQCNRAMDDSGSQYLHISSSNSSVCTGLNFTQYNISASDLNPFAALTYDATFLLAHGFHHLINNSITINGDNLMEAMLNNVTFWGATGFIALDSGSSYQGHYARGGREFGHYYKIVNFHASAFAADPNSSFVFVGKWSLDLGIEMCQNGDGVCHSMIFNTRDNQPANQMKPNLYIVQSLAEQSFLYALGSIVIICTIFVAFAIIRHRNDKLIKASQPVMLYFIIAGEVFAGGRVIMGGMPITDLSCTLGLWFGHLAFVFVFGALFLKTWRVNKIVNNTSLKRIKITNSDILLRMIAWIFIACVYLIVLTVVGKPHVAKTEMLKSNQWTYDLRCGLIYAPIHTALFVVEAVFILTGARLCYAVKDVPDAVNESKSIAAAMTIIVMMGSLAFPIVFLITLIHPLQQVIASTVFAICSLFTLVVYFGPKLFKIWYPSKDGDDMLGGPAAPKQNNYFPKDAAISPEVKSTPTRESSSDAIVASAAVLKSMSLDQKSQYCLEQINQWKALMLKVNEGSDEYRLDDV